MIFSFRNIAVLQRNTGNDVYDFSFRNNFDCRSVVTEIDVPVLLHIGAIEDYAGIETALEELGMKLPVHEAEHLRCSTIEEFRFFYFEGKCMAYGPYWYMGRKYTLPENELKEVLKLTDWAAERLGVSFPAIDVAKTAAGDWIIIEVNDAQKSGFVGVNPLVLWNNTISAMQEHTWISAEDLFEEGTVIMGGDPLPDMFLAEMREIARNYRTAQELVDAYPGAYNKFLWVEDDIYDFEEGSEEYKKACSVTDAWEQVMDYLEERIIECATEEGLFAESQPNLSLVKQMEAFMEKYGYRNGRSWWVRI